ncbi:MAG: pyridoxamine 5'-phosphate oxidase family protein [Acidobacteria bacterium]|nr:pyridoxamine 5'-phosphate oxidase family protein [Acidobacteriota bacterium]
MGGMSEQIAPTDRTRLRRLPQRGVFDRAVIEAILDEGLICHVSFCDEAGRPCVLPTGYARDGGRLLLHGSRKNAALLAALSSEMTVCVTLLDGLVLARSAFHHSFNYRSVVLYGRPVEVTDRAEKLAALERIVEHIVPGRAAGSRPPNDKELDATLVAALPIDEVSAKVRTGPPKDDEEDMDLGFWAGVIPVRLDAAPGEPAPDLPAGIEPPEYVRRYRRAIS